MGALIGGGIATLLSLCVLSRAIADNRIYRLAQALLVGIALGYISAVLLRSTVVAPATDLASGQATTRQMITAGAGLIFGLLLIPRFGRQRSSALANLPIGLLYGVGAAVALIGAVRGTLAPQLLDTIRLNGARAAPGSNPFPFIGTALFVLLTVLTLLSFTYTVRAPNVPAGAVHPGGIAARAIRQLGRIFVVLAFGVFFAATVRTYIAALVGQLGTISMWANDIWRYFAGS
jgi:hypothetical protein